MNNNDKTNVIEILLAAVGLFIQIILAPQIIDLTAGILFGLIIFFELKKKYNLITTVLSAVFASIFPLSLRFIAKIPFYSRLVFLSVMYITILMAYYKTSKVSNRGFSHSSIPTLTILYHKKSENKDRNNFEFVLIFYFLMFFAVLEFISRYVSLINVKNGIEQIIKDYLISRGIKYPFYFIFYVGALTIISEMAIEASKKLIKIMKLVETIVKAILEKLKKHLEKIIEKIKKMIIKNFINFIKDTVVITLLAALIFYPILYINLGISQDLNIRNNITNKDGFITIENYGEKSFKAIILDDKTHEIFIKPNSIEKIDLRNLSKRSNEIILLVYYNDILVHAMKIKQKT